MSLHVVLVLTGSAGDLFPFLRLGEGLRGRGHRVTVVAPSLHGPIVQQAGLDFHGTFADPVTLDDPDLWHPQRGFRVVWNAVRAGLAELLPFVAALDPGEECVLVAHPLALPAADLCRTVRTLTVIGVYLAPSNIPTIYDPMMLGPLAIPRSVPMAVRRWLWRQVAGRLVDPVALPGINADRAVHGLSPAPGVLALMRSVPELSVTLFPPWFGPPQPDWPAPLLAGDFPLYDPDPDAACSSELAAFLAAGARPVVFTHGTGNHQAAPYFAHALAAVQRLGLRAIFLTGHRQQVAASLPSTVLWQEYLPLKALLPKVALLVHHGGIGTTAEAMRAGVPQLVVPLAFDQFDNGARVQSLKVGAVLRHSRLGTAALCKAIRQVLNSSEVAAHCSALRRTMAASPSLDHVIDAIVNVRPPAGSAVAGEVACELLSDAEVDASRARGNAGRHASPDTTT